MASRRKNLLEAFQNAGGSPPASAGGAAPGTSGASGAGSGELFPRETAPRPHDGPRALHAGVLSGSPGSRSVPPLPRWLISVVALALVFALGFVLGKGSGREAEASDAPAGAGKDAESAAAIRRAATERTPSPARPSPAPAHPAPAQTGSEPPTPSAEHGDAPRIEDSALFDTRNVYTVVVAAYSSASEDLAWATYEHLADEKLPVFPPVASGKVLVVLVGAAPTSSELEATEKAVRALSRDGDPKAYDTAYRARIDKLIPRPINQSNPGPQGNPAGSTGTKRGN